MTCYFFLLSIYFLEHNVSYQQRFQYIEHMNGITMRQNTADFSTEVGHGQNWRFKANDFITLIPDG